MTLTEAQEAARARWGRATAFRVGLIMGEGADPKLNPPRFYTQKPLRDRFERGYRMTCMGHAR